MRLSFAALAVVAALLPASAGADEVKVLAAGATKAVVTELAGLFAKSSGHIPTITTDTAGGIAKRVEAGEPFEVAIATLPVVDSLITKGKLAGGSRANIASSLIGVAIKTGAPRPDISTVAAFKQMLIDAKTVAYVDPASGGTSGIYIAGVIDQMGLTEALKPKLRLQAGGYVAERVAKGDAEVVIHQISEILPVKGVTLIGGLPAEIQIVTTYSGGLAPNASAAGKAFLAFLMGDEAGPIIAAAGMEKPKP